MKWIARKKFIEDASNAQKKQNSDESRKICLSNLLSSDNFLLLSINKDNGCCDIVLSCDKEGFEKIYFSLMKKIVPQMEETINNKLN